MHLVQTLAAFGNDRDGKGELEKGQECLQDGNVPWMFLDFLSCTSKELFMLVAFSSQLVL